MRILLSLILLFSSSAFASECADWFDSAKYREGMHLSIDEGMSLRSRRPEVGSLEERHPGIARAIYVVMMNRLPYYRWTHLSPITNDDLREVLEEVNHLRDDLEQVADLFDLSRDDRARFEDMDVVLGNHLQSTIRGLKPFAMTGERIWVLGNMVRMIQSALLELKISTLIDGRHFWFDRQVMDFYNGARVNQSKQQIKHKFEREIDIIVERRDGKHMWVEVKNNAIPWELADYAAWAGVPVESLGEDILHFHKEAAKSRVLGMGPAVLEQLRLQKVVATDLAMDVEIVLVSKYPLKSDVYSDLGVLGVRSWPIYAEVAPIRARYFGLISTQF